MKHGLAERFSISAELCQAASNQRPTTADDEEQQVDGTLQCVISSQFKFCVHSQSFYQIPVMFPTLLFFSILFCKLHSHAFPVAVILLYVCIFNGILKIQFYEPGYGTVASVSEWLTEKGWNQ